jgi:Tat protein translocase TatB subunit
MRTQLAMFDFNWGEMMLIGVVALVAIGPKELPRALRTLGQWVAKARRMANEFQNQFHEAMREAELRLDSPNYLSSWQFANTDRGTDVLLGGRTTK